MHYTGKMKVDKIDGKQVKKIPTKNLGMLI